MRIQRIKVIALLLCATVLSGCSVRGEVEEYVLPEAFPVDFLFYSGAGAWMTSMVLERDGSFCGEYYDKDMGDCAQAYPYGTMYVCCFSGKFQEIQQIDKYSYSLTLGEVSSDYQDGKTWIADGVRYVSSCPYGVEDGKEFILYLPGTPTEGLPEEFLNWKKYLGEYSDTLEQYGLYNVDMGYGFFS